MKNLFLLMTAILLVNVSTQAAVSADVAAELGNNDHKTECSMISDKDGADQAISNEGGSVNTDSTSLDA